MANLTSKDRIWMEAKMGSVVAGRLADLYDALDTVVSSTTLDALTVTTGTVTTLGSTTATLTSAGITTLTTVPLTTQGNGAIVANKCTAVEYGDGLIHKTVLTLTLTGTTHDLNLADGDHGTGIKIYDFPAGRILILGATIDASVAYTGTGGNFYLAAGSAVGADDADLTSTEADIIPKSTIDGSAESPEDWHAALAASAQFDGTTTPLDLYINVACPDGSNTGAQTYAITGALTITWINLGDY